MICMRGEVGGDCETWNKGELWLGYNFCNKNKSYKMTMEL